ncbi:unnamed protein product [Durusdinium trenchii]|uniref:Uncharacterized protein n=2 Tax=Durusdinium trenchii TaxID=1381693 RepID=A0ABP0N787_9DINO
MPRERELEGSVRDCDALETLTDKLRSGEFSEAISAAQRASEQGPLCARADGGVKRADPYVAFAGVEAPVQVDEEDELTRLRRERKAQLQKEQIWKKQGHGALRELADEKEFVQSIAPHERAVMLLDDGGSAAGWLSAEKAFFLTQMIDLQAFPTIFVLSYGEVTRHLPPSQLFCYSSASSPLFPKHFRSLLHRSGAIEHAEDSESGSDAGESD